MSEPTRIDFLVFYRKQLQIICDKIDKQIEKEGGRAQVNDKKLMEDDKDINDRSFLESYVEHPGLIEALEECREYLKSISEKEQDVDGRLYYTNAVQGERFAMIVLSSRYLNLYITPRLGLYDNLPPEAWQELRFGKSQGDRWDKFQITSKYQANKAISYLKGFLEKPEEEEAEATEEDSAVMQPDPI